jgi:hypothetical protein
MFGGEEGGEVASANGIGWGSAEGEDCRGGWGRYGSGRCAEEVLMAEVLLYQPFLETGGFMVREEASDVYMGEAH